MSDVPTPEPTSMPKWPAWILFASMAACTYPAVTAPPLDSGPPPASAQATYRAVGTEPFWSVTMENGALVYEDAERRRITVASPRHRTTFNGHRYESQRLTLDISRARCSDGMSDRVYPDTVLVIADGRELRGCGGPVAPAATLAGTRWAITNINGEDVPSSDRYEIHFEGDRISGRAGCNHFSGPYRTEGERLVAGPLGATRMACQNPGMNHESFVFGLLRAPVRMMVQQDGTLVLSGQQGFVRLERR
jgi:uncharacterized membrane protein